MYRWVGIDSNNVACCLWVFDSIEDGQRGPSAEDMVGRVFDSIMMCDIDVLQGWTLIDDVWTAPPVPDEPPEPEA
jgi:hypothetical protein